MESLEKRIIYLKGISDGIIQGTNPNSSKYKLQVDKEIYLLQEQFQALQKKNIPKQIQIQPLEQKHIEEIKINVESNESNEVIPYYVVTQNDYIQFQEITKKINSLKEMIFKNNNQIQLLNRNKTYQNSLKVQNILKQNSQIQLQIQQKQQIYDLLNLKINNNSLYQKLYQPNHTTIIHENQNTFDKNKQPVKSILKSKKNNNLNSIFDSDIETKKHIQINIEKNEVKEIPVYENKKNIVLQKKVNVHKNNNNSINQNNSNTLAFQNKRPEIKIEESDEDLMKEFQNTIGSLQKLLI